MKKIIFAVFTLVLIACGKDEKPKDYAVIYGTIKNPIDSLNLRLYDPQKNMTVMVGIDEQGNFRDTLKLETPSTFTAVYKATFGLYAVNGMDIQLNFDTDNISETITFQGEGSTENNFMKFKAKQLQDLYGDNYKDYFSLGQEDFDQKTNKYLNSVNDKLDVGKEVLDSAFYASQKEEIESFKKQNQLHYLEQQKINKALAKGNKSPEFNDYLNYNGGTTSLKDFKGSYIYIDVWATWCQPCKYEIPYLEKLENEYHDKNIKFVSISIDQKKHEQAWRDMIEAKNMGGIQLLADADMNSKFVQDYFIGGIPRFILIDPEGKIIDYDAPRPSEGRTKTLINSLNI